MKEQIGLLYYFRRVSRASLESGVLAHILHRITGVLIVIYLFLHIGVMSFTYLNGGAGFDELMATFSSPPYLIADLILFAGVMIHALNGLRLMMFDIGLLTKRRKEVFWVMMVLAAVSVAIAAWLVGNAKGWW